MATLYPEFMDAANDTNVVTALSGRQSTSRERRVAEYYIKMVGTEAAADIFQLSLGTMKFPKGTTVDAVNIEAFIETDPAAGVFTVHVGDLDTLAASAAYPDAAAYAVAHIASDADRYAASMNWASVARVTAATGVAIAIPHTLQIDCFLTATIATLSTPTAGGKIRLRIPYFLA